MKQSTTATIAISAISGLFFCAPVLSAQTPPLSAKAPDAQTPAAAPAPESKASDNTNPITQALDVELKRNFSGLKARGKTPLYFLAVQNLRR